MWHDDSLIGLFINSILPEMMVNPTRPNRPLIVFDTGSVRFDVSKGPFTTDSQYVVMPFLNRNVYIPHVPRQAALALTSALHGGPLDEDVHSGEISHRKQAVEAFESYQRELVRSSGPEESLSYGYVTHDACGHGQADDTAHRPLPAFTLPEYVGTKVPDGQFVDVAFFDFIGPVVVRTLNFLQKDKFYTLDDILPYSNITSNNILINYAKRFWPID